LEDGCGVGIVFVAKWYGAIIGHQECMVTRPLHLDILLRARLEKERRATELTTQQK
jgi:hypothetical protein